MTIAEPAPGTARSRGVTPRELLQRESEYQAVPPVLLEESYQYLGCEDLSVDRYIDPDFAKLECEKLWPKVWQMACRLEEIPEVGDHIVYDVAQYSIIVVRASRAEIKAYYNSCLHRGTSLREEGGSVPNFRCPFHGWTWNLDGSLKTLTSKWDFPHVEPSKFCLPECLVDTWGGFVFINMDLEASSLHEYLEVLPEHFRSWDMERRFKAAHVAKEIPCNWKVAMEAFIEAYHVTTTHPEFIAFNGDENSQYDIYGDHISRFINPMGTPSPIIPLDRLDSEEGMAKAYARDFRIGDPDTIAVPEGSTARQAIADATREVIGKALGADMSNVPNCDAIDSIEYFVFPNFMPWPVIGIPIVYRFRPVGVDPHTCLMEIMLLAPLPPGVDSVPPVKMRMLGADERWDAAPELGLMGVAANQDSINLPRLQRGMLTSKRKKITLSNYQEVRIRHFHQTLDKYLSK
jgi:phenylpropionate dioxygenase-like ring-hydroxylating dioxygenase large terminal subunit